MNKELHPRKTVARLNVSGKNGGRGCIRCEKSVTSVENGLSCYVNNIYTYIYIYIYINIINYYIINYTINSSNKDFKTQHHTITTS